MQGRVDRSATPVETWERRSGAACAPLGGCRRREPERPLLHAVVRERLEPFLAAARDRSPSGRGLPAHVERDLRAHLDSCNARRMEEAADHCFVEEIERFLVVAVWGANRGSPSQRR